MPILSSIAVVATMPHELSRRSNEVLRERDLALLRLTVLRDVRELLDATVVSAYEPDAQGGELRLVAGSDAVAIPALAAEMEAELLPRALAAGRSLLSTHPLLDPALAGLAGRCHAEEITTWLLLLRAHQQTLSAFGVHWLGRERPHYEQRAGFYNYMDTVGLAVATARERERVEAELDGLRQRTFSDKLTGLPNEHALDEELARHQTTTPFSALVLDFDGLREANTHFNSYELGGDVLIHAVGQALAGLARGDEFAARMHTAGDEFALLLPGIAEEDARGRAAEVEAVLDALVVPETHRRLYLGASVGWATRNPDETPGQVLGRAVVTMRERKETRKYGRHS